MRMIWNDKIVTVTFAALVAIATIGLAGAISQVGQPFPGFLVLENRVIASVGLSIWPGTQGGDIYQHQVVAVEGQPVQNAEQIRAHVASVPRGNALAYTLQLGDERVQRDVATRVFGWRDFALLYGLYLINGVGLTAGGLVALRRRRSPGARACAPLLLTGAVWVFTALDLYGPYHLFRLHALCEAMLFPAALVMALGFPEPARLLRRQPWLPAGLYGVAAGLALVYEIGLDQPGSYVATHLLAVTAFGVALCALVVSELDRFLSPSTPSARESLKIVALAALIALVVPIVLTAAELLTGGRSPQNALALTGVIFPISIAYALLRGGLEGSTPIRA